MYKLRERVNGYRHGTVELSIYVPRHLIAEEHAVVTAKLKDTWLQVFNQQLDLKLNAEDGYYITRTQLQNAALPRDGNGWECGLDEQVGVFVNKFRRTFKRHAVVLCAPRRNRIIDHYSSTSSSEAEEEEEQEPQPPSLTAEVEIGAFSVSIAEVKVEEDEGVGVDVDVEVGGGTGSVDALSGFRIDGVESLNDNLNEEMSAGASTSTSASMAVAVVNEGTTGNEDEMEEEEANGEGDEVRQILEWGRDEDDLESLATGVGRQMSALRQQGIAVDEMRAKFEGQVRNCSDNLVLGVMADVLKQQDKPSWDSLVQKMPSVCRFLDKIVNQK